MELSDQKRYQNMSNDHINLFQPLHAHLISGIVATTGLKENGESSVAISSCVRVVQGYSLTVFVEVLCYM